MLTEHDREVIFKCARKYRVSSISLFGSSIKGDNEPNDIDLGVKGLKPKLFFKFYAELIKHLSKPVDLIDLSKKTSFNEIIEGDSIKLYG